MEEFYIVIKWHGTERTVWRGDNPLTLKSALELSVSHEDSKVRAWLKDQIKTLHKGEWIDHAVRSPRKCSCL